MRSSAYGTIVCCENAGFEPHAKIAAAAFGRRSDALSLWWRQHPNGSFALLVPSGLNPIEFEKGKPAIAVSSLDELPSVIAP